MNPGPPFDYTTPFNPDPFRRGQWAAFHHALKKQIGPISLTVIFFALFAFLVRTFAPSLSQTNPTSANVLNILVQAGFLLISILALTYAAIAVNFSRALKKQIREFTGKTFHTTITQKALTVRNPVTFAEKTYPLQTLIILITHPDFLILKHEHEYLYIGTQALKENQAYDFFVSNIKPK